MLKIYKKVLCNYHSKNDIFRNKYLKKMLRVINFGAKHKGGITVININSRNLDVLILNLYDSQNKDFVKPKVVLLLIVICKNDYFILRLI